MRGTNKGREWTEFRDFFEILSVIYIFSLFGRFDLIVGILNFKSSESGFKSRFFSVGLSRFVFDAEIAARLFAGKTARAIPARALSVRPILKRRRPSRCYSLF